MKTGEKVSHTTYFVFPKQGKTVLEQFYNIVPVGFALFWEYA